MLYTTLYDHSAQSFFPLAVSGFGSGHVHRPEVPVKDVDPNQFQINGHSETAAEAKAHLEGDMEDPAQEFSEEPGQESSADSREDDTAELSWLQSRWWTVQRLMMIGKFRTGAINNGSPKRPVGDPPERGNVRSFHA